jgi:hypothetical protein
MKAPFRIRPQARGGVLKVNEDPKRLDDAYKKMLGPGGDKMLGDEVKWLAVTHKSFDHGKRGFNDRLAYLGMSGPQLSLVHGGTNNMFRPPDNRTADFTSAHTLSARKAMAKGQGRPPNS